MIINTLKKKNIAFLALTQNSEKTLSHFLNFYKKIKKKYKNCYLIIGENDSRDNTKVILKAFKKSDKNFILVNTDFARKYEYRLEKMSNLRETISKKLNSLNRKIDYICWLDLDDVIENSLSVNNFYNANLLLVKNKNLFGVSATSKPYYYDILSFRMKNFFMKNIYFISLNKKIIEGYKLRKKNIYDIQLKVTNSKNLYTISSFNGMCIYNYNDYKHGSYIEKKSIIRSQVEHVTLNKKIHKKTKKYIFIDKNLILSLPKEHMPYKNFIHFCFIKLLYYLLRLFNL